MKQPRPAGDLSGTTYSVPIPTHLGPTIISITINRLAGKPWEVFLRELPEGHRAMGAALARVTSAWLQDGGDVRRLTEMLRGQREDGPAVCWPERQCWALSLPDALGILLEQETNR